MQKKKILMLGCFDGYAMEPHYKKELEKYCLVEHLDIRAPYRAYTSKMVNKLGLKLGRKDIYIRINQSILEAYHSFLPDAVWVFKGMEVFPQTLFYLKQKGVKLICYNGDSPFDKTNKGAYNKYIAASMHYYDLYLSYSKIICEQLEKEGIKSEWFPFCSDVVDLEEIRIEEEVRACFIGNYSQERREAIAYLLQNGVSVTVYGTGWKTVSKQYNQLETHPPLQGKALKQGFYKYRVQLNFLRTQNIESHNMRTFDIPAYGGIALTLETTEQKLFFEPNTEVFYYTTYKELLSQVKYILSISKEESQMIRHQAFSKAQRLHTYQQRISKFMNLYAQYF